jgi:hypothetical protein
VVHGEQEEKQENFGLVGVMATRYAFGNVEERGRPQAYARNFVDEASTGVNVAKAWGGVGNAMQGLGTMLVQRADRQARYDAMMANRDYQRQMRQRMNDPEKGIKATRKLGDARGVTQDTDKFADDLSSDIKSRLSPEAQKYFDEIEPESREPFVNDASRYEAGETQKYNNMGFESSMQEHMDTVRSDPYNQEMFDMSAKEGILAIRSHMQGAPEASIRQAERDYLSGLEAARIGAIAENDPVLADELAQESTLLTPEDKASVQKGVAPEIKKREAAQRAEAVNDTVEDLWKEFGTDEESARKSIYDSDLPSDMKDKLWQRYEARAADERRFEKQRRTEWANDWYKRIESAGSYEAAIKMIEESDVEGKDKQQLLGVAKKLYPDSAPGKSNATTEDPLVYSEVYERIARGEITTAEELVAQYGDKLKPSTIKSLTNKIVNGAIADENNLVKGTGAIKKIMDENDITEPEERAAFLSAYSDEVLRQQEEKKRKLTPIEKEMIARALAVNEIRKKEHWFMDKGIEIPKYQIDAMEGLGFKWDTKRGMWVMLDEDGKVVGEISPDEAAAFIQDVNSRGGGTRNTAPRSNAPAQQGATSGDVTRQEPADGRTPAWESRYGATYDRFSGTGEEESGDRPTDADEATGEPKELEETPSPETPADATPAPAEDEPDGADDENEPEDEADKEEEPDSETQQDVIYLDNPPSTASAGWKRRGVAEAAERTVSAASGPRNTTRNSGAFQKSLNHLWGHEGGYVNDPVDRGGETNLGITRSTLKSAYRKGLVSHSDPKKLTREEATIIYKSEFWDKARADELPAGVGHVVFDMTVNHGPDNAARILQKALGIKTTKKINDTTIEAANKMAPEELIRRIHTARQAMYNNIVARKPSQKKFANGWQNRNDNVTAEALAMARRQ